MEALEQVAMHRHVNEDEDDQLFCDEDSSPALVLSKVLTLQHKQDEDQRCHIFHTKADINGRSVKVIIDGGSCHNLASENDAPSSNWSRQSTRTPTRFNG